MSVAQKRNHAQKTLQEKCQALKDIEKGLPNKDVATKYGVPKNTMECPGKTDLLNALELLQKFFLFSANGEAVQVNSLNIERNIDNYFMKRIKQTRTKDHFKL